MKPPSCWASPLKPSAGGEREGQLSPDRVSEGGTHYYDLNPLLGVQKVETDLTIVYARVSSQDQKEDLKRQAENLERYCARQGWRYELIQDLGSGMNYRPSPFGLWSGQARRSLGGGGRKRGLKRFWR